MKKYKVTITETLEKEVEVEAENYYEAEQTVRDAYGRSEYVLDSDNFIGVDFMAEEIAPDKIKVVLLEPDKVARTAEIGTQLKDLQAVVGGDIQAIYPFDEPVCIVMNDDGKLMGLDLNRGLRDKNNQLYDIIVGNAFICDCSGEDFGSLNDEQLKKYTEKFKLPEKFYRIGEGIKAVPYQPKLKNQER